MTVTLALAKQHLEYEDTDRDALINQYIAASVAWVENYTGKKLALSTVVQEEKVFGNFINISRSPFVSLTSIEYTDINGVLRTVTGARIVKGRIYPPEAGWPATDDYTSLKITYQAGYLIEPSDLVSARLLLIGHFFLNREASSERPAQAIELSAQALCDPYRHVMI